MHASCLVGPYSIWCQLRLFTPPLLSTPPHKHTSFNPSTMFPSLTVPLQCLRVKADNDHSHRPRLKPPFCTRQHKAPSQHVNAFKRCQRSGRHSYQQNHTHACTHSRAAGNIIADYPLGAQSIRPQHIATQLATLPTKSTSWRDRRSLTFWPIQVLAKRHIGEHCSSNDATQLGPRSQPRTKCCIDKAAHTSEARDKCDLVSRVRVNKRARCVAMMHRLCDAPQQPPDQHWQRGTSPNKP